MENNNDDMETISQIYTDSVVVDKNNGHVEEMSTSSKSANKLHESSEEDEKEAEEEEKPLSPSSLQEGTIDNSNLHIPETQFTPRTVIKTDGNLPDQLEKKVDDNGNPLMDNADDNAPENDHVSRGPEEGEVRVSSNIKSSPEMEQSVNAPENGHVSRGPEEEEVRAPSNIKSSPEMEQSVSAPVGENRGSQRNSVNSMSSRGSSSKDSRSSTTHQEKKKKVGHYLLERTVGKGSYAAVVLATHLLTRHKVAVKVVSKRSLVQNEAARHHFRREALILQKLSHPNVVRLYEAMETNNAYYLVFELATNGHLLSLVSRKGNLSEEETRTYMKQMISAVDHLHQSDIIHRDIKLENFLLDENKNVKLVDFGFSTVCHRSDLNAQCGCPVYAAPEVFAGRKYGRPVDVWSLGVCFYGMLLGRLPFLPVSNSLPQLFSIIMKGCLIPAHLTPSCQNLLSRMLDLQEERRIAVDEILLHHWLTFPDGQPIKRYRPIPRRLPASVLNQHIVKYMCTSFRFSESDITNSVIDRRLSSSAATYHILKERNESDKWRERTPKTSVAELERPKCLENSLSSTPSSAFPKITAPPSGLTVSKPASTVVPTNITKLKYSKTGPCTTRSGNEQEKADSLKLASSNAYKSYILVLKQSRNYGTEPLICNHTTNADDAYLDVIRKFPPFFNVDATNNSSSPVIPHISKSATMLTSRPFVRINQNRSVALGVTGTKPSLHVGLDAHLITPGASPTTATKFPSTSPRPRPPIWKASSSASAPPHHPPPPPPPAPPNSSLGGPYHHHRYVDGNSPEVESPTNDSPQSIVPPKILIQNRATSITGTPPKRNTDSLRPSLSSLRESFSGDVRSRSRVNIRAVRPKPSASLLRSKTVGPITLDMQIQGTSPPLIEEKEREPMDEDLAWRGKCVTLEDYPAHDDDGDDEDLILQDMTRYLDALTGGGREGISPNRRKDRDVKKSSIENVSRSETIASFPLMKKPSNHNSAFPEGIVRTVSIHTSSAPYTNFPPHDSPSLFQLVDEANAKLSQPLDRDDFMTPVTRVTITTKGRDM